MIRTRGYGRTRKPGLPTTFCPSRCKGTRSPHGIDGAEPGSWEGHGSACCLALCHLSFEPSLATAFSPTRGSSPKCVPSVERHKEIQHRDTGREVTAWQNGANRWPK